MVAYGPWGVTPLKGALREVSGQHALYVLGARGRTVKARRPRKGGTIRTGQAVGAPTWRRLGARQVNTVSKPPASPGRRRLMWKHSTNMNQETALGWAAIER